MNEGYSNDKERESRPMIKIPALIRAEAQARGMDLTGVSNFKDGVEYWHAAKTNTAIGFDQKQSKYVTIKN